MILEYMNTWVVPELAHLCAACVDTHERYCMTTSGPRATALCNATRKGRFVGVRFLLTRHPGSPEALLDIRANHATHDLGGRKVFLGAHPLEQSLLARIDQDGQTSGALFEVYDFGALHLHLSYIVE
jgi:hypothetical protein